MGFERIFEWIAQFWQLAIPWLILNEYQRGVVLRFGRFHRELGPGFHWIAPFGIEEAIYDSVVTSTTNLAQQSLTTADNHTVVVSAVITHKVHDVKTLFLEVEGKEQVMIDIAYGVVTQQVTAAKWDEIITEDFAKRVYREVRKRAFRYGVEVLNVQFSDMQRCKSLRLWTANSYSATPGA